MSVTGEPAQRIDKWLWHARVFRTRSLAARFAASGKMRVNGARVAKAAHALGPGDVLTFALHGRVRVLRVAALADRRGSPGVASGLYDDLSPPPPAPDDAGAGAAAAERPPGAGRPTKRERRRLGAFTSAGD